VPSAFLFDLLYPTDGWLECGWPVGLRWDQTVTDDPCACALGFLE
jgi:hypothetical protein